MSKAWAASGSTGVAVRKIVEVGIEVGVEVGAGEEVIIVNVGEFNLGKGGLVADRSGAAGVVFIWVFEFAGRALGNVSCFVVLGLEAIKTIAANRNTKPLSKDQRARIM